MLNKKLPLRIDEVVFDCRANREKSVRILELGYSYLVTENNYTYRRRNRFYFISGGFIYLKDNKWLIDPKLLTQGTDTLLKLRKRIPEDASSKDVYEQESPINPLTPEFQKEIYERLHEVAKPELVRELFLEEFGPCENIDLLATIMPEHGFLHFDGSVHACYDFIVRGRFKKRIGDRDWILYARSGYHGTTGGFYLDGHLNSLKPHINVVSKPEMKIAQVYQPEYDKNREKKILETILRIPEKYILPQEV